MQDQAAWPFSLLPLAPFLMNVSKEQINFWEILVIVKFLLFYEVWFSSRALYLLFPPTPHAPFFPLFRRSVRQEKLSKHFSLTPVPEKVYVDPPLMRFFSIARAARLSSRPSLAWLLGIAAPPSLAFPFVTSVDFFLLIVTLEMGRVCIPALCRWP